MWKALRHHASTYFVPHSVSGGFQGLPDTSGSKLYKFIYMSAQIAILEKFEIRYHRHTTTLSIITIFRWCRRLSFILSDHSNNIFPSPLVDIVCFAIVYMPEFPHWNQVWNNTKYQFGFDYYAATRLY